MIKHIVMWDVRAANDVAHRAGIRQIKQAFEGLRGRIPGLRQIEVGVNHSVVDYACDVVLYSEFDSAADLEAYASHPEHLRVRDELGDLRIARHQVDYVIDETPV